MKNLVVTLAVTGLLASAAFATPKALSSAQLDTISAGAGIMDVFLGTGGGSTVGQVPETGIQDNAVATDAGTAVRGNENETGLFVEDNDDSALAIGTGNKAIYTDQSDAGAALNAGDNAQICLDLTTVDYTIEDLDESVAFIGDNNEVLYDASEIDADIDGEGYGVIARTAEVCDSFNIAETDIDIDVDIDDSFNVETNSLEVCPQQVNAIVFAAGLGDIMTGTNLNVTTATAVVPTAQGDQAASLPIVAGNAIALTIQKQINIVNSIVVSDIELD
jgi:hypothetical protein